MFEYEGVQYTLADLQKSATDQGYDNFEEFVQMYVDNGMKQISEQTTIKQPQEEFEYVMGDISFGEDVDREIVNIGTRGVNSFLKAVKGVGEYGAALEQTASDWYGNYIGENEDEKKIRLDKLKVHQDRSLLMNILDPAIDFLEQGYIQADKTATEEFKEGNYGNFTRQVVSGGVESIPSLLAAYSGVGGLTALAVSVAGNKFDEEFEKEPEKSSAQLLLNATGSGVIEAGFELVTRGIMRKAGILKGNGQVQQAKEVIEEGSKTLAISMGVGGEALSESSTQIASLLYDQLTLDRKVDWAKAKYEIFDAGIIGGFVGGNITSFGEYTKNSPEAKERAVNLLTHPTINKEITKKAENLNKLIADLAESSVEGKKLIKEEINKEYLEIQGLRNRSEQGLLNLNKDELQQYAKNIEQSIKLGSIINSKTEGESAINAAKKQNDALVKSNLAMLETSSERTLEANLAIAKDVDAKIGLEQVIIKTDAEFAALPGGESGADGFISDGKVYINREIASKLASVSVGSHELLHGITAGHLLGSDGLVTKEGIEFIDEMRNRMSSKERAIVEKRIEDNYKYQRDDEGKKIRTKDKNEYYDEYLNVFHDAIVKKQITYNPAIEKIGQVFSKLFNRKGFDNIKFNSGRDVYDFVKSFSKDILKGKVLEKTITFAKPATSKVIRKSMSSAEIRQVQERVTEIGLTYNMEGGKDLWDKGGAQAAIDEMKRDGTIDNLIASKYKVRPIPTEFVGDVFSQLIPDIRGFNPEQNDDFGGYLGPRITFRAGDVYKKIYEKKGPKKTVAIEERTKEGEVRVQVAAETDVAMEALETEDLSPAAQAKKKVEKAKGKEPSKSELRQSIGIKDGSDAYNTVLETARKVLIRAYDAGKTTRQIQRDLTKESSTYLFKQVKNMLGTKRNYIRNITKFRVPLINSMFTADLVQLERNVPDNEKVFTRFVKKLTSKQEVQSAVDNNLLPPSALNIIDKGTAVSLYEKVTQIEGNKKQENDFIAFFDQPLVNPKTGARSGLRGTRKDQLAKYTSAALNFDAIMQVAQESEVINKRQQIAEIKGQTIDVNDIQNLAEAIDRDPNVKFSLSSEQITENLQGKIEELVNKANQDKFYFNKIITVERDENGKAISYKLNIPLERGKNMPGPRQHSKENKEAVARIVYKYITNNEYGSIVSDKKLQSEILREIIIDNKNGKTTNQGLAHENIIKKQLQKTVSLLKNSILQVVGGGKLGDIYASLGNIKIGIETKLEKARSVSQSLTFLNNNLDINFPNKNITTNDNGDLFDDIIGKQAKEQYNKFLKDLPKKLGEVKNFTLTQMQADWLVKNGRSNYLIEIEVPIEHVSSAYASGKYKDAPQGFIVIGRNIYRMVTGNTTVDELTSLVVAQSGLNIQDLQLTKNKKVKLVGEFMSNIGRNKKINFRIAGRINSADYVTSNVDITNNQVNKRFINAINDVLNKKSTVKLSKSAMFSRSANNPTKGITVLDFDDTLATTKSLVRYTAPDGKTGTLNAEQYASTYQDLLEQGYKFDFSEFNKVVKGKIAPLFQKAIKLQGKFGSENMFVLTARPPQAQKAIFDFLKANGLNIPLKNITGLGNSTAEAKALWVADKVGEGYNDFYFADDALQNVQAVKNMLEQFDVKSKVQQAKVKFSKSMNDDFNNILEEVTGIDAIKRFSDIKARKRGESKGKFRFFIPPSHEDFVGLLYNFMGKGRKGDKHRDFFEQALVRPLNRAYREINTAKQAIANDYKALNKRFADVKKKLTKKTPDGDFIFEDAIRVYLWNKHGYDIPGLSETDQAKLTELVMNDAQLREYAENINIISKQDKYVDPSKGWESGNIQTDLIDATGRVGRAEFFAEFNENADILFSEENLNKIEAAYGADFRGALEDMLHRISTGVNRPKGQHATVNKFMNYLNGSVGTVMFFNVRSAILQQMSIVNYINFADNNMFAAAKAFANQKQYWKDFAFIFNSDMLKQRRGGIGTDINGADLAQAVKGSKDPTKVVIGRLLKLGFLPTQIGDNIAIATGGATFYRNRINKYVKDGLSQKEAEAKAFTDFQDLTQSTQQSSRPDMTSQQQASWIGKLVLNFQNITSQYNRIIKKAALDVKNRRISPPYTTQTQSDLGNLSKILYYGGIQNVIFYSLQTALFAVMFDDDKDEDQILKKRERVINGSIDSILRGAGIYGAVVSTLKNAIIKFKEQREKGYNKDESAVPMELLNFSPVVGIKVRQLVNAEKTLNYNENVIGEMETFEADNPMWSAVTNYTQALTNFPANRLYQKSINMRNALDKDYTNFQRVLFFSGYTTWSLGLGDNEAVIEAKEKAKINKANTKKRKKKYLKQPIRF